MTLHHTQHPFSQKHKTLAQYETFIVVCTDLAPRFRKIAKSNLPHRNQAALAEFKSLVNEEYIGTILEKDNKIMNTVETILLSEQFI